MTCFVRFASLRSAVLAIKGETPKSRNSNFIGLCSLPECIADDRPSVTESRPSLETRRILRSSPRPAPPVPPCSALPRLCPTLSRIAYGSSRRAVRPMGRSISEFCLCNPRIPASACELCICPLDWHTGPPHVSLAVFDKCLLYDWYQAGHHVYSRWVLFITRRACYLATDDCCGRDPASLSFSPLSKLCPLFRGRWPNN